MNTTTKNIQQIVAAAQKNTKIAHGYLQQQTALFKELDVLRKNGTNNTELIQTNKEKRDAIGNARWWFILKLRNCRELILQELQKQGYFSPEIIKQELQENKRGYSKTQVAGLKAVDNILEESTRA